MKQIHAFYSGRVQGVGFRATTLHIARGFDIVGTVRNCTDGAVELIAEGAQEELEALLQAIDDSDLAGFIKEKKLEWKPAQDKFQGFKII